MEYFTPKRWNRRYHRDHSPEPVSLSQSEERYRDYFENAKDAIYVHDLDGHYIMVNKAGEELIGYSREEILQMRISDVVPRTISIRFTQG